VGDFPLQIAFSFDGSRAIVSNYFSDSYSLINIDGASSSVVGTWSCGDGPMRVAYDSFTDQFAIGLYTDKAVKTVDPSTGAITGTYSYASSGNLVDLDYDADGSRFVLTAPGTSVPCRLHRDSEYFVPAACDVRSGVYDLSGRLVSIVSESSLLAGSHSFVWDAPVPAGVYAVCLDAGSKTVTRLMTVCE
jgi:hypothetical protein